VIGVFLVLTLVPFAWLILSSLKTNQELFSKPFGLPARWLLNNYTSAFAAHPLTIFLIIKTYMDTIPTELLEAGAKARYGWSGS
jgi:ABC-type glycerol-3-phosphate transport system permease component